MSRQVKIKESNLSKVHKVIIGFLIISTLITLALIILPRFEHIKWFLVDFAEHHLFMALFIAVSLMILFVKFLHEYFKSNSLSWAGMRTYEYYNPVSVRIRWQRRLQRMKKRMLQNELIIKDQNQNSDVLLNEEEKHKRYRDLLNAMSLGNNFKHKVKIHLSDNNKVKVIETTVWYANANHVTLKGGKVIPVTRILKVEY